jgi:quinol monooxygenase YgiN
MVTLIAKAIARPGKEALLAEECVKLASAVRENEQTCLMYIPHVSADNPAEIVFLEKYVSQDAFATHVKTPYFKQFEEKSGELLAAEIQVQFLTELG